MNSNHKYAKVQAKLRKMHKSLPWSHMSKEVGLSASTIKKFANNETFCPQFRTVDMLADYCAFRLAIQGGVLEGEVLHLSRIK